MNDANELIIPSTVDLDIDPSSDRDVVKVNQALAQLYQERRRRVIDIVRQLPSVVNALDEFAVGRSYQAVIPRELVKRLKDGTATWDKRASGFQGAIIRDTKSGKIICHVSLREITPELLSSISQLAVQSTLTEVVWRLEAIDQKISLVLRGQQNDRLAIVEGGIHLFHQAMAAHRLESRRPLLMSAIDKLNEGRQRLVRSLGTDIEFFDHGPGNLLEMILRPSFGNPFKEKESKAKAIQEELQVILRASYVLASAYDALGELDSLRVSLQPLRDLHQMVGAKGSDIARWLPYDASSPPEELWRSSLLQLADGIESTSSKLELLDSKTAVVVLESNEVTGGETDDRADL